MMKAEHFDNVAQIGLKSTVGGFLLTIAGNLTLADTMTVFAGLLSVGAFIVTWYYKRKSDRRNEELFLLRKKRLEQGRSDHAPLIEEDIE